jgi:hypothetical protein
LAERSQTERSRTRELAERSQISDGSDAGLPLAPRSLTIEKLLTNLAALFLYAQRIDQHLANGTQLAQYVIGNGLIGRRVTDRCAPALRQREV